MKMADFSFVRSIIALSVAWVVYEVLKALYNVSPLHPLHKIPGPKLAAATYLPEFYHDVVQGGRYTHAIRRMHEQYGPIVRINPNETHCNDVNFSDEIFAVGGRKRDKPAHQISGSAAGAGNSFGTKDHDLHRIRRGPVAKFFSQAMIARLEDEIHGLVHRLCDKLLAQSGRKEPIDVAMAYSCFTSDAIFGYCFGEEQGFLRQEGWYPNHREATLAVLKPVFFLRFFPILAKLQDYAILFVDYLPDDVALLLRSLKITVPGLVTKAKAELDAGIRHERPTVFVSLLESDLDAGEKGLDRLAEEAITVVNAGTETTSWALTVITYHLLDKPQLLAKLRKELEGAVANPNHLPPWTVLEKLPYLGAVIQEGLRLSYGVSARTAREATQEDLIYRGEFNKKPVELVLPRGYAIGMSAAITHHDETVFPESHSFIPERWLDENNQRRKEVERGMMAWSKGSRACLGKNLALCELHLSMAALVLRVIPRMSLFETTERDVAYDHDMFIPRPVEDSRGVRVTIE